MHNIIAAAVVFAFCTTSINDAFAEQPSTSDYINALDPEIIELCDDREIRSNGFGRCGWNDMSSFCATLRSDPSSVPTTTCAARALVEAKVCMELATIASHASANCELRAYCGALKSNREPDASTADACSEEIIELIGERKPQGFALPVAVAAQSALLQGATDFFVVRAKHESILFLRDQLADELCSAGPWKIMLPRTCQTMKPGGKTTSADNVTILPQAFREDLARLPISLVQVTFPKPTPLACLATTAASMTDPIRSGQPLSRILQAATMGAVPPLCAGYEQLWAQVQEHAKYSHDYYNLIESYADAEHVAFQIALARLKAKAPDAQLGWLNPLIPRFERLATALKRAQREQTNIQASGEAVRSTFEIVGEVLAQSAQAALLGEPTSADVRGFVAALSALAVGEYSSATVQLFGVSEIQKAISASLPENSIKYLNNLQKHIQIIAAIAEAKTPEDAQRVLESVSAPVGSWREFRRRSHAGFLGAMLGFGGGAEIGLSKSGNPGGFIAPTLPVGLEIGLARCGGSSVNLLTSMFDLGAIASLRLDGANSAESAKNNQASMAAEPTFLSLFSPGVTVAWGIGDTPFVLALGAQFAPAHRSFFQCLGGQCTAQTVPVMRLHTFLGVDLPVLPIF